MRNGYLECACGHSVAEHNTGDAAATDLEGNPVCSCKARDRDDPRFPCGCGDFCAYRDDNGMNAEEIGAYWTEG